MSSALQASSVAGREQLGLPVPRQTFFLVHYYLPVFVRITLSFIGRWRPAESNGAAPFEASNYWQP
jgi:hypothetical protein